MADLILYIDGSKQGGALLTSLNSAINKTPTSIPFVYPDTVNARIYLFDPLQTTQPGVFPFSIKNTAGLTLLLEITNGDVDTDRVVYTSQYTWATDANNQYFYAQIPLSTDLIKALLAASEPGMASAWLKIAYVSGGFQTDVFSQQISIAIGVGTQVLVVPPPLTPASVEVSNATYFPKKPVAGEPLQLMSAAGKIQQQVLIDNPDGTATPTWIVIN